MRLLDKIAVPNPWESIIPGQSPYVHDHDRSSFERHNRSATDTYRIRLDVYPEPYLGNPEAPVLLLNLNPGWDDFTSAVHAKPTVTKMCIDNLLHKQSDYPFYPLSPSYRDNGGSSWWSQSLRYWIERHGLERVAHGFSVLNCPLCFEAL